MSRQIKLHQEKTTNKRKREVKENMKMVDEENK